MFEFLKKKKEGEDTALEEGTVPEKKVEKKDDSLASASVSQLAAEIEKIKASLEAFTEVRKSTSERFNRISEQIGELRAMILDRDKTIQEVELKSIKAYDLVETVQPEKIMTEVQKQEANETIMDRVMEELKDAKQKIKFFRGVEEIVKLSEEVKQELIEIKKIESKININTDKIETIYAEVRKKYQMIDSFDSELQEMKAGVEQNTKDAQFAKDKINGLASKDDLDHLVHKVQRYVDALKDLEKKSSMSKDIDQLKSILEGLR